MHSLSSNSVTDARILADAFPFQLGPVNRSLQLCLEGNMIECPTLDSLISNFAGISDCVEHLLDFVQKGRLELSSWPPSIVDEILGIQLLTSPLSKPLLDIVNNAWASATAQNYPATASFSLFLLNTINTMRGIGLGRKFACHRSYTLSQFPQLRDLYSNWDTLVPTGAVLTLVGFTSMTLGIRSHLDADIESITFRFDLAEGVRVCGVNGPDNSVVISPPAQFEVTSITMSNKNLIISLEQTENTPEYYCRLTEMSNEDVIERGKRYDGIPGTEREAFRLFKLAADRGSAEGLYLTGMHYKTGKGVARRRSWALRLFELSAKLGSCDAMWEVAEQYSMSSYAEVRVNSAPLWRKEAALNGHAKAQHHLACEYERGLDGNDPDLVAAFYWCSEAAKKIPGDSQVAALMARCFQYGCGVAKNIEEAWKWYVTAALAGDRDCQFYVAGMYAKQKQMENAAKFYLMAAEQRHVPAQYELAKCLEEGNGVPKDMFAALNWYTCTACGGNSNVHSGFRIPEHLKWYASAAQCRLGQIVKYGIDGTTKNALAAVEWFKKSCAIGFPMGIFEMGVCMLEGVGIAQDFGLAEQLLKIALQNGVMEAQLKLAHLWLLQAAENGLAEAQFQLGCSYKYAHGGEQGEAEAKKLFEAAARQGHAKAQIELASFVSKDASIF